VFNSITFFWDHCHSNVPGNDQLAKHASDLDCVGPEPDTGITTTAVHTE